MITVKAADYFYFNKKGNRAIFIKKISGGF